ncbi:MAG: enoyl-CoA hydratase/isomerase family protein, partial [Acidimicrobiia bacterium]
MLERTETDGVVLLSLAHGKVNAMDTELLEGLRQTFRDLGATDCPAVVLTGAGRAFSAGVDLTRLADGGAAYAGGFLDALTGAFEAVFNFDRPVVAAVNGHA